MEEHEPQKTYLDGFKEGTEYALKLIKENKWQIYQFIGD
jgi:hypothetical protein